MRVLLRIPRDSTGSDYRNSLTVGSEYEVLGIEADWLRILDDKGEPTLYEPQSFEVVDPKEPAFLITTFGKEGERYAYPPGWGVPGFFEAWHDRDDLIRAVFAEQLAYWYPIIREVPSR